MEFEKKMDAWQNRGLVCDAGLPLLLLSLASSFADKGLVVVAAPCPFECAAACLCTWDLAWLKSARNASKGCAMTGPFPGKQKRGTLLPVGLLGTSSDPLTAFKMLFLHDLQDWSN
jgi:hypothetical protein